MTPADRQPLRLLLLEHDSGDAELCLGTLRAAGFDVHAAVVETGDAFLDRIRTDAWDAVLAEFELPQWTGPDALAAMREAGVDIPFILVTRMIDEERAVDFLKRGANDLVLKQNVARLPGAIRRALAEKDARAEAARAASVIRTLTKAVEQSPASVIVTNTRGEIEYVNAAFTRISGYAAEDVVGRNPRILDSGLNPPEMFGEMWAALEAGREWSGEIQNRRRNGAIYWDAMRVAPVRNIDGVVTHFVATQEDITERREIERGLRERDERFRQITDNIHEVFYVAAIDFSETLYVSPAYEEIWGRPCQTLYDDPSSFLAVVPESDRASLIENIRVAQMGEDPGEVEFRVERPDGAVRWVLGHAVPVRDENGVPYRLCGVALDITERRAAEDALREREERFRKLADASFDGIVILIDGIVHEANRGCAEMFGYEPAELNGMKALDFVAAESYADVTKRLSAGFEGRYEFVGSRKDGGRLVVEATARNHHFDGKAGRITALRNVTETRLLEQQYHQAQKMEAVGRLAGGVAHDFNNLLTVITGCTEMLLEDVEQSGMASEDLGEIRTAAAAATALTRQLLAFSRREVIEPRIVAVEDIVANITKILRRLIGEDIELKVVESATPSIVLIDPGQLEQVVMNLVVNARDAMPSGGTLTITTEAVALDAPALRAHEDVEPGRFVRLSVRDDGIGMDEETRRRVFEPFFTTKGVGKGTGLGLATVYGIVRQSGGFIGVDSEKGVGTTFTIHLPLVEAEEGTLTADEPDEVARGGETVLLVEDDTAVRAVIRQILVRYGYEVLEADRGEAAISIVSGRETPIDLLLTDVVMPEMNGRELAGLIRELRPDVKLLFMSGYTDDAMTRRGPDVSGSLYIQKPFTPEGLARMIRKALEAPAG